MKAKTVVKLLGNRKVRQAIIKLLKNSTVRRVVIRGVARRLGRR